MNRDKYANTLEWLKTNPSMDELCAKFPDDWAAVQQDISGIVGRGVAEELKAYLERISKPVQPVAGNQQQHRDAALSQFVRSRMAHESVRKLCLSVLAADTGVKQGKLRFNLFNGFVAQRLLFSGGLVRKPVSLFWFRLLWPLVWQKKRLMPLVQPKGIYCFYSRALIEALAGMIAGRSCLEIGAGDGTLARFLKAQGVQLTATDNHGWEKSVVYPDWVLKLDARVALRTYAPEVVICSWPPAQNDFERAVFDTPSVQLYIVIGSRHQFAFGNWKDYTGQSAFVLEEDKALSALVLPPELESVVYVFRRKPQVAQHVRRTIVPACDTRSGG
ncbi:MAG: class I SAM-dependent methyltransferase [Gammaproteobacteria bacterium]|nr:class I SAM-dependent methyltransferase [Gammaproteobacteria bacterium]MBU1481179.1 class I SAM-dependent methyltransferase [Gammaproteobacteria bacterium]